MWHKPHTKPCPKQGAQDKDVDIPAQSSIKTWHVTHMCASTQAEGNGTCVLVGDDEVLLAKVTALAIQQLGCQVVLSTKHMMPAHVQQKFNRLSLEDRCAATLHPLTDMELLAHTDFFVGAL